MPEELPLARRETHLSQLSSVAAHITQPVLSWLVHCAEHAFVLLLEGLQRAIWLCDPRLYFERWRIRKINAGLLSKRTTKFLILVIYSRTLPSFTMNLIRAIRETSFNLIVVSNGQLEPLVAAELLENCCLLVERANIGRDFGGYKDGISIAFHRFRKIEKLIIANDSVFYLGDGLDKLIADLDGAQDFIGISEVFEHHYHVASFMLSFGQAVLDNPSFHKFWKRYLPIHTRRWAILRGEGGLTKCLMKAGYRPHVLFRADRLLPKLQELSASEAQQAMELFPTPIREKLKELFEQALAPTRTGADDFAKAAIKAIMATNQMHAAGFLFVKFLGLPLFKRDIVYRELFSLDEARQILASFSEPMRADIIADLTRRPAADQLDPLRRMLHRHGLV